MSTFSIIQQKLEQFIKKYYTNELIKGAILFFALGVFYFLITLLVEYFLWLDPVGRAFLFWAFVLVELTLFIRFIAFPLAKLFKLQEGISHEEASKIIGNHFPQVSDKLLNVIQLNQNRRESELLLASIEQKADEIEPIAFKRAINFTKNIKYLKYAVVPAMIFLLAMVFGDADIFSSSYKRVVNYDTAYDPPAEFIFQIANDSLNAIENKPFVLKIRTEGEVTPENATISFNDETYYLESIAPGYFEHTFSQPTETLNFQLRANRVISREYQLNVVKTPSMVAFDMILDYPSYTGKLDEIVKSSGNATIPEGTKVTWNINTKNTTAVALKSVDSTYHFTEIDKQFSFSKNVSKKLDYSISTSNVNLIDYENLSFALKVIKDEFPEIEVQSKQDTTQSQVVYFLGQVRDDYGLSKLRVVYFPEGEELKAEEAKLPLAKSNFDQFVYTFPNDLPLADGVSYEYYFEVFDNDVNHGYKSSKSPIFSFRKLTKDEWENAQLEKQDNSIKGLDRSLENLKDQDKRLEEISKTQKEKNELNWNDKKKLENFIKRQKQQEEMMKNFSKELKENLENFQPEKEDSDEFKEQLKDRIKENEEQMMKNEKLLDELEKIQDKIEKEDLGDKLEKLSKQNKSQEKNLEQLVELTKRYYVTKKAEKLAEEIFKLGEEQEKLADQPDDLNTKEEQEKLNEKFEKYQKEKEELEKENEQLKKPMDIPNDEKEEEQIEEEQNKATDNLEQKKNEDAKGSQKKAGKKMKQLGEKMQASMQMGDMETLEEDVDMLRQILDNLVVFSFEQEELMEEFKKTEYGNPVYGKNLTIQNDLKLNFQHIDDSIFSLSLRQPIISVKVNESLVEVQYNLDKSLEHLAQNQQRQGGANQQYTITGANELAILLSDLLNNMQMQMSGQGSGKGGKGKPSKGDGDGGKGFQLPDIIKKQESLSEKMKDGLGKEKKGQGKGEGSGEGQGSGDGDGENGENGRNGKDGNDSKDGDGNGESEFMNGELFEIYKQQQDLRQQLEDRLSKEGLKGDGGALLRQMEGIEQQLLDKGFNEGTLQQMLNLKYELMKLDEANFEQGEENKRESRTNRNQYKNSLQLSEDEIKKYFNVTEILNREALPLRQEYKQKVQTYFRTKND